MIAATVVVVALAQAADAGVAVQGGLPTADVVAEIDRHSSEMVACYEDEIRRDPSLKGGRVVVHFVIGADGKVVSADAAGLPKVDQCLRLHVMKLVFARPMDGGTVDVRFPFAFCCGAARK